MRYMILGVGLLATLSAPLMTVGLFAVMPVPVMAQDKADQGDTPATAEKASVTGKKVGSLSGVKDVDFFKIEIRKDRENPAHDTSGYVTLNFSQEAPPGSNPDSGWRIDFYHGDNLGDSLYTVIWPETMLSTKLEMGLTVGIYYYKISSLSKEAFPEVEYTIKPTWEEGAYFEKSPNESPDNATPLVLNQDYAGNLSSLSDVDYYRFGLEQADTVSISLSQSSPGSDTTSGWSFGLLNQLDQAVKMLSTEQTRMIQANLTPGVYYVRVESFSLDSQQCEVPTETTSTTDSTTTAATKADSVKKAPIGRRYQLRVNSANASVSPADCAPEVVYGQNPVTLNWVSFPSTCDLPSNWYSTATPPDGFQECPVCPVCPPIPRASYIFKSTQDGLLEIPVVDLKDEAGSVLGTYSAQLQQQPEKEPAQFQLVGASSLVEDVAPPPPATDVVPPPTTDGTPP